MTAHETALAYWRICQTITGRSSDVICARDAVEFLTLGLESKSEALRNACASTLRQHYSNVPVFPAVTSFTTEGKPA